MAGLGLQFLRDILRGDGTERFAAFAGFEHKRKLGLGETAAELLGFVQFAGLTLGAAGFEGIRHPQRAGSDLVGHAAGDEEVAGVSAADFDDICLGPQAGHGSGQNDFGLGHGRKELKRPDRMPDHGAWCQSP